MGELTPDYAAGFWTGATVVRRLEVVAAELLDHRRGRAQAAERRKDLIHGLAHLGVGGQNDPIQIVVGKAGRQGHLQLAAPGFVQNALLQTTFQDMQFGFAHRAFEAQQQTIVESGRIVQTVLIEDQRIGECAQLEQTVPVGVVTRQTGDFQPHYKACFAKAYLSH